MALDRSKLSEEGRRALDEIENDPRADAERVGPLYVFLAAIEEAERACRMMESGAVLLERSLEIEEALNGPATLEHHRRSYEYREELARIDRQAGHPFAFGMALVAAHGALDHFVESVPICVPILPQNEESAPFLGRSCTGDLGLEPRTTEPESAVLPITPIPKGRLAS